MNKKALIVGHTGQDGFYLREILLSNHYDVVGISQSEVYSNFDFQFRKGDVCDATYTDDLIKAFKPDELYYLAALHQSSVETSYNDLEFYKKSIDVNAYGLLNFLNSLLTFYPSCKVFYASSSHIFGGTPYDIQNEETSYCPVSIYGITKVLGMQFCELYKQKGVFCSAGIFYNHESPRRDSKFVSKKIVETAVAIKLGKKDKLELGDLSAKIDWGYAPDYVYAAFLILQNQNAGNYIISSGQLHTVEDFVAEVFNLLQLDWKQYVVENKQIILKKSVTILRGDSTKLKTDTKWKNSVSFNEMIKILVENELMRST